MNIVEINTNSMLKNFSLINNIISEIIFKKKYMDVKELCSKFPKEVLKLFYKTPITYSEMYNSKESVIELKALSLRLSRHHMKRANFIEQISEVLAFILYKRKINLQITEFELVDRPSMMVVNRTYQILKKEYSAENLIKISMNCFYIEDQKLMLMRKTLFKSLFETNKSIKNIIHFNKMTTNISFNIVYVKGELDAALLEQNYELAYLLLNYEK